MSFAVCVTFDVDSRDLGEFMELMRENAKTSLEEEDGCQQFDVCSNPENANEIFLYEIYDSPDAFQIHLKSQHFQVFDTAVKNMINSKQVKTYEVVT